MINIVRNLYVIYYLTNEIHISIIMNNVKTGIINTRATEACYA